MRKIETDVLRKGPWRDVGAKGDSYRVLDASITPKAPLEGAKLLGSTFSIDYCKSFCLGVV